MSLPFCAHAARGAFGVPERWAPEFLSALDEAREFFSEEWTERCADLLDTLAWLGFISAVRRLCAIGAVKRLVEYGVQFPRAAGSR